MKRIAIQGERGCFHDIAAHQYFSDTNIELVCCNSFEQVFDTMKADDTCTGLIAIENTNKDLTQNINDQLKQYAEKYSWSYISMKRNCVTLALNSAIKQFPKATKLFKLDEDIFITEGFFETLPVIHELSKKDYFPVFTAPLIPINGYGYRRILEKLNLVEDYAKRFEYPRISAGIHMQVESNPDVAMYFWHKDDIIPKIDEINTIIKNKDYTNDGGGGV